MLAIVDNRRAPAMVERLFVNPTLMLGHPIVANKCLEALDIIALGDPTIAQPLSVGES